MSREVRFWLAVGIPENWHTAFDFNSIWGLKANQRHYWEALTENTDIIILLRHEANRWRIRLWDCFGENLPGQPALAPGTRSQRSYLAAALLFRR